MTERGGNERGKLTYKAAGVDVSANDRMVDMIGHSMRRTYDTRVLSRHGGFAGLISLDYPERLLRRNYMEPVLVAGADGVGSKLLLGLEHERVGDLGIDLVAMCANDVLTTGAEPVFFLDYVACHRLVPSRIAEIVAGISRGCTLARCALLGGETAEMPELYQPTHVDLAGFCVGIVERRRIIDGRNVEPGDVILGLASSGIHSNGYSLVRKLLDRLPRSGALPDELSAIGDQLLEEDSSNLESEDSRIQGSRDSSEQEDSGRRGPASLTPRILEPSDPRLADALLRPTRIYVVPILGLLRRYRRKRVVRAMAHITGGGLPGNLPRVIPRDCDAVIWRRSWPVPPIFRLLQHLGVDEEEMYRVFNMGIGFVLVVRPAFARSVAAQLEKMGEVVHRIGVIRRGSGRLVWR